MSQNSEHGFKSSGKLDTIAQSARELLEDGKKTFQEVFKVIDCNESVMERVIIQGKPLGAKLNDLLCLTGMYIVQITGIHDVPEDEDEMLFELLAQLRNQYEMLRKAIFIQFTRRNHLDEKCASMSCPGQSLDAFVVSYFDISDSPETRRVADILLKDNSLHCLKHPLYDVISKQLLNDSSVFTAILTEIYSPFLHICQYIQDLHVLSTDLRSILQLSITTESFFAQVDCFKNRWLDISVSGVQESDSTPEPVSERMVTEISTLFDSISSVSDAITTSPPENVTSNGAKCKPPNLFPFDLMVSFYSQIPIALYLSSPVDKKATEFQSVVNAMAWFLTHALQADFQVAFLSLISDRTQMLLGLIKNTPDKQRPCETNAECAPQEHSGSTSGSLALFELVNKYCIADSKVKANRIKSSVQSVVDFTRKEFIRLFHHDIENEVGSENVNNSDMQKRKTLLFGKPPKHMPSILSFTCLEAARSPYFSQATSYTHKQGNHLEEESTITTNKLGASIGTSEIVDSLHSLPLIREFSSRDQFEEAEKNAGQGEKKSAKSLIQQDPQFFMNLKGQIDAIYNDICAETAV